MKKEVKYSIAPPKYVSKGYVNLFTSRESYLYKDSNFLKLNNVFLSNSGIVLKNGFIPLNSAENLTGLEDHTFYFRHLRKALEQFIVCRYGKSLKSVTLNSDELYFSIHTAWFGYFSWVTTYLPRIFNFLKSNINATLLYPEEWDNIDFVKQTLSFFPELKICKIPVDHHVFIPQYLLVPCRRWTSHFDRYSITGVRDFFINKKLSANISTFEYIYISRIKAKRRKVVNELQILQKLDNYGVHSIVMEDYSYIEQVILMQNAKLVIGIHGAGMTNINYMNPSSKVLEFTPILSNFKNFRYPFWRMANLLSLEYYCIFCEKTTNNEDEYDSDVIVPEDELFDLLPALF